MSSMRWVDQVKSAALVVWLLVGVLVLSLFAFLLWQAAAPTGLLEPSPESDDATKRIDSTAWRLGAFEEVAGTRVAMAQAWDSVDAFSKGGSVLRNALFLDLETGETWWLLPTHQAHLESLDRLFDRGQSLDGLRFGAAGERGGGASQGTVVGWLLLGALEDGSDDRRIDADDPLDVLVVSPDGDAVVEILEDVDRQSVEAITASSDRAFVRYARDGARRLATIDLGAFERLDDRPIEGPPRGGLPQSRASADEGQETPSGTGP